MAQPIAQPRSAAKIIWQQGALFGLIIGVLAGIISFLPLGGIGTLIYLILWLGGFFAVGLYTARQTGKVGTGALSGLVAGLASGIVFVIIGIITIITNAPQISSGIQAAIDQAKLQGTTLTPDQAKAIAIGSFIVVMILFVLLQIGIGAGLGAIGGAVGKSRAKLPPPLYQEQPYQS